MFKSMKYLSVLFLMTAFLATFTSCEKDVIDELNTENTNSNVGTEKTDFSEDFEGECDSLCFTFNYPITVNLGDGSTQTLNSDDDFEALLVAAWESETGGELITLVYPIAVTLADGTVQTLNSDDELDAVFISCFGDFDDWDEGEWDDEEYEECFTINYPISISFPGAGTATVNSDEELYEALENFFETSTDTLAEPALNYPIEVTLQDGTVQTVNSDDELDTLFEDCYGDWDDDEWEDEGECFTLNYPLEIVLPDGSTVTANDDEALFEAIDAYYEANPDSEEMPSFTYPITVTLEDSTTAIVNSDEELEELFEACFGEFEEEFDECFTFNYPLDLVLPDGTTTVNSEEELYAVIDAYYDAHPESDEIPTFDYPIEVTLTDGTVQSVGSDDELDALFDECYGGCEDMGGGRLMMSGTQSIPNQIALKTSHQPTAAKVHISTLRKMKTVQKVNVAKRAN